jgi:peptidoglycan hydrolase-like protein with peptidoglycan-binding domain
LPGVTAKADRGNDLPPDLMTNLIKAENGSDKSALSHKCALGIARFAPATAIERGLAYPHELRSAIRESARYMKEVNAQFGNFGSPVSGEALLCRQLNESGSRCFVKRSFILTGSNERKVTDMPFQKPIATAVLALTVGSTSAALAADAEGRFALRGFGAERCSDAQAQLEADQGAAANGLSWLLGYMTAINRAQSGTFDVSPITDGNAMLQLVVGLCQQNPDSLVETVAYDLLRTLAVARVESHSPLVETRANGDVAEVRSETLVAMQNRLREMGHLSGSADGIFGPQTRNAIRAFQRSQDMAATGIADSVTILRLLVEMPHPPYQEDGD